MKWNTIFDPGEADGYGHWESDDNHFSIQCFVFRTTNRITRKVKRYYSLYDIWKGSKKIGEFTTLKKAQKSVY